MVGSSRRGSQDDLPRRGERLARATVAGFTIVRLDRSYLPKEPPVFGSLYEGAAAA